MHWLDECRGQCGEEEDYHYDGKGDSTVVRKTLDLETLRPWMERDFENDQWGPPRHYNFEENSIGQDDGKTDNGRDGQRQEVGRVREKVESASNQLTVELQRALRLGFGAGGAGRIPRMRLGPR